MFAIVKNLALIKFLYHPTWSLKSEENTVLENFKSALQATLIALGGALLILGLTSLLLSVLRVDVDGHYLPTNDIKTKNVWDVVFLFVIFGPVVEEIFFRFWIKPQKTVIVFGSLLLGLGLILALNLSFYWVSISFLISILLSFIPEKILESSAKKYFGVLVYFGSFCFALAHIGNYMDIPYAMILVPILVLPQFWTGLCFSYVRTRNGLDWSILTHASYNAIILFITLLIGIK
jgi:hypothetical protein